MVIIVFISLRAGTHAYSESMGHLQNLTSKLCLHALGVTGPSCKEEEKLVQMIA